jgi:beta-lactamase superfamily II metal-dependent hydrolase
MYRVGFGDFFLLSFRGADGTPKHVLIDCGVHHSDLHSMPTALAQMKEDTGGKLALVIMTHRHADHIAGFGSGADIFKTIEVERVWMSWFENPADKRAANFQANLAAAADHAQSNLALAAQNDPDVAQLREMALNITGGVGLNGKSGNEMALDTLKGGFATKAPVDYYQAGQTPTLPDSLVQAGVTAQILSPPHDESLLQAMDNHAQQYLASDEDDEDTVPPVRLSAAYAGKASDYPKAAWALFSAEDLVGKIEASQPAMAAALAAKADQNMNNQSLVVLFKFNGKTLLFPGDAQWGNWDSWLFEDPASGDTSQLAATAKSILGSLDFYKVGHHGSTNANPIPAVEALRPGCVAMVSTQPLAYGNPDKRSEVPRIDLLKALNEKTNNQLARSDQVALTSEQVGGNEGDKVAVPPWAEKGKWPAAGPVNTKVFKTGPGGTLYIDYEM